VHVGRVRDPEIYSKSSSGGILRWVLAKMLNTGLVQKVIHVRQSTGTKLFEYAISSEVDDIYAGATSAYYPVELSEVINTIFTDHHDRYAIVGLPCFIKGIRKYLAMKAGKNPPIKTPVLIGMICGHLKSSFYAEMLSEQMGVPYTEIKSINFRKKIPGHKANEKGVAVVGINKEKSGAKMATVQQLFGTDYGCSFFKYKACDFCDDVFAETADFVVGDAWLPEYLSKGTSLLVVRSREIERVLQLGVNGNEILLEEIPVEKAAVSQDAGLRHRREGLAYRLYLSEKSKKWAPVKRVHANRWSLNLRGRLIQRMRIYVRVHSAEEFKKFKETGDFQLFERKMRRLEGLYSCLYGRVAARIVKAICYILKIDYKKMKHKFTRAH